MAEKASSQHQADFTLNLSLPTSTSILSSAILAFPAEIMKTQLVAFALTLLATLGAVTGTPVAVDTSAAEAAPDKSNGLLAKRVTGSLKAWTGSSGGCSGNPGWTWANPGNGQCITFVGGDGLAKIVHRLSWDGDNCVLYAYQNTWCGNDVAHPSGTSICLVDNSIGFLGFKVVC
ncbi:hypothetical protein B0H66DRAFT_603576 [Apodospora peruviana]|uniref:Uncharacterized protein n=1 Tax=Apodospora peruviana TaxID=516989 RepID=A0AAE0M4G6_9PEZI|nr:hypothetical protein B0H66DRAFT_603576 [Apodospora peruviana]